MQHDYKFGFSIARLREALATANVMQALERLRLKAGFNPNQPRVPAGNPDGGQWTDGGGGTSSSRSAPAGSAGRRSSQTTRRETPPAGRTRTFRDRSGGEPWKSRTEHYRADGSVASQTVENRDGSRIEVTRPSRTATGRASERSKVDLPDGRSFTFETQGKTQRVYDGKGKLVSETAWTPKGPQSQAIVRPASGVLARETLEAGQSLYNWLSTQNSAERRACFAFRAWNYEKAPATELLYSGMRTRKEVQAVCTKLKQVQKLTNTAAEKVGPPSDQPSAAVYGTKVHSALEKIIEAKPRLGLKSERSYTKAGMETGRIAGTIRIDVIEERDDGTLCIYDIKTGKRGLAMSRVREFALRASKKLEGYSDVVVVEVRPFEK